MNFFDLNISKYLLELKCVSSSGFYHTLSSGYDCVDDKVVPKRWHINQIGGFPETTFPAFSPLDFLDGKHAAENCKKVFGDADHLFDESRDICGHCKMITCEDIVTLYCWQYHQIRAMQSENVIGYISEYLREKILDEMVAENQRLGLYDKK